MSENEKSKLPEIIEGLHDIATKAPIPDVTGAALRSIFVGAVLVGGLAWLTQVFLRSKRPHHNSTGTNSHSA